MKHRLSKSRKGKYYLLIGPYDEEVVARVKDLPPRTRSWDPKLRAWRIDDTHEPEMQAALDEIEESRMVVE